MSYEIMELNNQGKGICYVNNKITFVDNTLIGDIVTIKILKETKKYNLAVVDKYIEFSDLRMDSFCPYSLNCGGCQFTNLSYENTLKFKKEKLIKVLKKFANINMEVEIIPSQNKNYRNKITLKVQDGIVGYYKEKSNSIIEINKCEIANDNINEFIKYIKDSQIRNGEVIIRCNYNNELLVNFITDDPIVIPVIKDLKICGILKNGKVLYGSDCFIEIINNKFYQVSYNSFFQVNRDICSKLFDIIDDNIMINSIVVDLYCGVGTLGINIAHKVKKIYGIEVVSNAIINAIKNSKMNHINNAEYMLGDASKLLPKIKSDIDVIICDPPRSGLTKEIINTIKKENIKQIIYVSCDPITLARDIKLLSDIYGVVKIIGLDMFPYTYHVECVALLCLKTS